MKRVRFLLICVVILAISLSCKAVTGGSYSVREPTLTQPTEEVSLPQPTKATLPVPKPGGVITKVTLAHGAEPETYDPVDPATQFLSTDTIHAIVTVKKAPSDTLFTAKWFTTSIELDGRNNEMIDTTEIQTGGTGNLDFTLAPQGKFPAGSYRVEIYVNNNLDQVKAYKVIAE